MISVVQRVRSAHVMVEDREVGRIGRGLLALVGAVAGDGDADADHMAQRLAKLRIFGDENGRMNLSLQDVGGAVLVVSQFTLAADTRKGRRPSFVRALPAEEAAPLVSRVRDKLLQQGLEVETGVFGALMQVHLVNDGPVTLLLDSRPGRGGDQRTQDGSNV